MVTPWVPRLVGQDAITDDGRPDGISGRAVAWGIGFALPLWAAIFKLAGLI